MFARLLAKKKKNPEQPEDAAEKRLKKIMDVVGKVDTQINTFTKQAEAEEEKRKMLLQKAKEAKLAKKQVALKRYLQAIKLSDQKAQRLSNLVLQLETQKSTCEAILQHSDFAQICNDTTMLINEFGMDPDAAQVLVDKAQEWKDQVEELDSIMADGVADDGELDDIENELDELIAEESELPDVPLTAPTAPVAAPTAPAPVKKQPAAVKKQPVAELAEEDDLDSMLNGLDDL